MYETISFSDFTQTPIKDIDKKLDSLVFMVVRGSDDLAAYIDSGEFKLELSRARAYNETRLFDIINKHLMDETNNIDELYFDQFVRFRETFGSIHVGTHYDAHEKLPLESINFWVPGVDLEVSECLIFLEKPIYDLTENLAGTNKPGLIFLNNKIIPDYGALGNLVQVELQCGDFLMFKGGKTLHMSPDTEKYRMSVDQRVLYIKDKQYSKFSCSLISHFVNHKGENLDTKENDSDEQSITYDPKLLSNLILQNNCLAFEVNGIDCSRSVEVMLELLSQRKFELSNLRKNALQKLTILSPENPKKVMQAVAKNIKFRELILFYFYILKHQGFNYLMNWILCRFLYSRFGNFIERKTNTLISKNLAFKLKKISYENKIL